MEPANNGGTEAAAVFFEQVARHILAQHQSEIPDLRRGVVAILTCCSASQKVRI